MTISPSLRLRGKDGAVVQDWLPGVQVQQEEVAPLLLVTPPQDTRRVVDVMMVECSTTAVGRSGTGLAHIVPEKVRYSTEEVLPELLNPPRIRRWSAGK